jgi:hypothetical protein
MTGEERQNLLQSKNIWGLTSMVTNITLARHSADVDKDLSDESRPGTGKAASSRLRDRPHDSLFAATLITEDGPMHWEIADHRTNRPGSNGTWKERVDCLICGTIIE